MRRKRAALTMSRHGRNTRHRLRLATGPPCVFHAQPLRDLGGRRGNASDAARAPSDSDDRFGPRAGPWHGAEFDGLFVVGHRSKLSCSVRAGGPSTSHAL